MKDKSPVVKRSVIIANHKTSVSVEDLFWRSLKRIAADADVTISTLIEKIDQDRAAGNLSSALRTFVLGYYRRRCGEDGMPFVGASVGVAANTALRGNGNTANLGADYALHARNGGDPAP